jgi:16S rRNA processing protein RimM
MSDGPEWLHAGRVGAPHGLDGSFRVADASPRLLVEGGVVRIGGVERTIERRAGFDARVILRLEGCGDRDAAQSLRGQELFVERSVAPDLEEDEWWAEDLEGLAVRDGSLDVGVVKRLLALPSCEVLEVTRVEGGPDLLVPLVADAVRMVDLEDGYIDVDMEFLSGD